MPANITNYWTQRCGGSSPLSPLTCLSAPWNGVWVGGMKATPMPASPENTQSKAKGKRPGGTPPVQKGSGSIAKKKKPETKAADAVWPRKPKSKANTAEDDEALIASMISCSIAPAKEENQQPVFSQPRASMPEGRQAAAARSLQASCLCAWRELLQAPPEPLRCNYADDNGADNELGDNDNVGEFDDESDHAIYWEGRLAKLQTKCPGWGTVYSTRHARMFAGRRYPLVGGRVFATKCRA
jgi:hypothetical protein